LSGPIAALVVITASGGAILTFTPHILASPALGFWGLLAFTGAAAASRWVAGGIADRFGATAAIAPLLFTGALGLAAIGLRADSVHDTAGRVLVIAGLLLTGIAYGGLQNLTLAQAFNAAGEPARSSVSIAWNLSFDAGTGLGAFAVGAIATAASYSVAFGVLALAVGFTGVCWARRLGRAGLVGLARGADVLVGMVQVAFEGFGDGDAVAGSEEVEQKSAGDGDDEPGFCSRGLVIQAGFLRDSGCERGDPGFDRVVQESFGARAGEQRVGVQLEEQPFGRP
jgi:hypothetical protein